MKKLFCLFLAVVSLLCCTACADWEELSEDPLQELNRYYQSENESPSATEISAFALPYYDSETLDSVTCSDGVQQVVGRLLYEPLYALDNTFVPQPVLAESCHYDAATYTYVIQLRSGVCFSDGSPLTAQDVADTLHRAAQSERYGSRFTNVGWLSGSGSSISVTMLGPDGGLLSLLDIPIVKSGTEMQKVPLGTGPYAVAREENGTYLSPNPHWWQQKRLPLSRIELFPCKSSDAANYAFSSQNVQLLCTDLVGTDVPPSDVSGVCTDAPDTVLQYLGFNLRNELLAEDTVRQAISAVIDRNGLVNTYLLGHGSAVQFPLPSAAAAYPHELETAYSRESADAAMQKAGLTGGEEKTPLILLINEENRFKVSVASQIAKALNRYDLDVTVQSLPWEDYLDALHRGRYDLYYGETKLHADWDLTALIGTGGALNYGGYSDEATDELLQTHLAAQDEARNTALYELCRDFSSHQPIVPICCKAVSVLVAKQAVEQITPTAADPFYQMENWIVHLASS